MIYIMCPAGSYTGGPTLAHQLCFILNKNNIPAQMWYFCGIRRRKNDPVHAGYKHFNNPYTMKTPEDNSDNIIVSLESRTPSLRSFKNAKRIIWWMSVDNFFLNMGNMVEVIKRQCFHFKPTIEYSKKFKDKKKYQVFKEKDILHYVQSEYARIFLINEGIDKERIFDLGDYIEDEVIEAHNEIDQKERKNAILYNPKKGFEFTQKIIAANPQYEWIPLINMSKTEVTDALLSSKLYIDFGNHPGKDRFPREAVLCGCCLITGRRGAAYNDVDIPIDSKYKFKDELDNIPTISEAIQDIMLNYNQRRNDFSAYCERTIKEKEVFQRQAVELFGRKS